MSKVTNDSPVKGMANWELQAINTVAALEIEIDDLRTRNARLLADNKALSEKVEKYEKVLRRYEHQCDKCYHAKIMHLHDGTIGECVSVDCYDPRCERFENAAFAVLPAEKGRE